MRLMLLMCLAWFMTLTCGSGDKRVRVRAPRGSKWWSLAKPGEVSNGLRAPVRKLYNNPSLLPLTKRQRRLVTKNPGAVMAVVSGARMAIDECQHQFRKRRWNCPIRFEGHRSSIFGKIIQKGCRETAFVYSITSAAVAYSVGRACSQGTIQTCSCDNRVHSRPSGEDWEWSGCSDNAKFGHKFSRKFVDVLEKGRDFRYMINLHNNEVGRVHVSNSLRRQCKCHGMSGSCTIKTCWMTLPDFRSIGLALKDRFDGASQVLPENSVRNRGRGKRRFNFSPANSLHKKPGRRDLVYFEDSPNFCDNDSSLGFDGTKGRECNHSSLGVDGCDLMCCGRGFHTEHYVVQDRCQCIFEWCCEVKCKMCTFNRTRSTCL
ncbi:protein wnt [Plakobranchus ocellatus]|uniref:Protein Wnt n=1 Tax=Plakobranchus ocellatus TaxID=259542 RepID=A0AAV4D0I2_9GAST|nr:protein wnt [Plakobranchus ocellatus]